MIEAQGSPGEIGHAIGRALASVLVEAIAQHQRWLSSLGIPWEQAEELARRFRDDLEATLPRTAEELHAMAQAAGVSVDALISLNALQETTVLARRLSHHEQCTSIGLPPATKREGVVLLAHNEDASPARLARPAVLKVRPADEPAFLTFTYGGLFLYQGVNEAGIGSTGNALSTSDIRIGVPKLFLYREVLRAITLPEAIRATMHPARANGNNHLIATAEGEVYDVEVTGRHAALLYAGNVPLVHTNHVLSPELRQFEEGETLDSELRRNRARRLIDLEVGRLSVESLQTVLRDHANAPASICKHPLPSDGRSSRTIASLIIDVTHRALWVTADAPCRTTYERYTLD